MSRENDKKDIWVVSPIVNDDGEIKIIGYDNLRHMKVYCVPASGYIDVQTYGDKVSRIMKFNSNVKLDISDDGNEGIYFEEPTIGEDELYHNPPYLSTPVTHFGKQYQFNAEKQVY